MQKSISIVGYLCIAGMTTASDEDVGGQAERDLLHAGGLMAPT